MRSIRISKFGVENLEVVEVDRPAPSHGEVLVRLHAASLNYRDLLMVEGKYNPRQPLPLVPCSDGAGVVEAVGAGVTAFEPGDRVMSTFFVDWDDGAPTSANLKTSRGGPVEGCLQEYVCAPATSFVSTPGHLTDAEAATLPCAAVTAWSALVSQGGLQPGESVLILGTGGVSMFAIQIAKLCGAHIIATSSSDAKLEVLRSEFGVTDTINYADEPQWGRVARDLSDGGVDHVVEVGGVGTLPQSLRAVRPGGTISLIGVLAEPQAGLDLTSVLMRNIRIQGVIVGNRRQSEAVARAFAQHELRPVVDRTFELADSREAFEHLRGASHMGKVVITM